VADVVFSNTSMNNITAHCCNYNWRLAREY